MRSPLVLAAATAVVLTGCGSSTQATPAGTASSTVSVPAATPSLAPSGRVTPNGSLDPAPATSPSASRAASGDPSTDPLYLEAVQVYTAYVAEMTKIEEAGSPSPTLPPVMDKYLAGSMKEAVTDTNRQAHDDKVRLEKKPKSVLAAVATNPGVSEAGSEVSIRACIDATDRKIFDASGAVVGSGALVYRQVHFKHFNGQLKAFVTHDRVVTKCPLS